MTKPEEPIDINELFLKAHELGIKMAIDLAVRTNTRLVVYEDGKLKKIKPPYKYVRVPTKTPKSKKSSSKRRPRLKKTGQDFPFELIS